MAKLNYNHLYYFWVIAKEGNLGRAADKLFVAQSAVSTQLKKLEQQFGHPLFLREGRTLKLTEAGKLALSYADKIFSLGNELHNLLRDSVTPDRVIVRIGVVASLSRNFVENFIKPLLNRHNIELVIDSGNQEELLRRLHMHQLDIVLTNYQPSSMTQYSVKTKAIARQQLSIVGKPLKSEEAFKFPEDLLKYKLLLPGLGTEIRATFDLICDEKQIRYSVMAEINDMPALRLLVRDSNCIGLLPKVVVQDEIRNGTLQEYCKVPGLFERFYAITAKRQFEPEIIKLLLERKEDEVLNS